MKNPSLVRRWQGRVPASRGSSFRKSTAALAATALVATAVATMPASGTVVNVGAGHNITVFHNIDFVAVFGYSAGETLTVAVVRNGVTIGTATGAAAGTAPEIGLEVNHGPAGAPVPGDCWEGRTPDIQPGDHITVTSASGTDEVIVDNLRFTGNPTELASGDIVVPFLARRANGTAIAPSFIDSAEFRAGSRLRFEATDIIVQRQPGGAPGQLQMRYRSPFTPSRNRDLATQAQMRRLLLGDGHATGFGHVAVLPAEAMLLDGLGETPGPAPGCASPSAQWGVTSVSPATVNIRTQARGLTLRGLTNDADSVTVRLTDNDPATPAAALTKAATLSGTTGRQTWTASLTPQELAGLNGRIRVGALHTLAGGSFQGTSMTVLKDLVAPDSPRASVPAGTYRRAKLVALRSAPSNQIRFTLGDGSQAGPTRSSGNVYNGRRIRITSTQTLKMIAIDPAGNASPLVRIRYRIQ